jgi:hypothetical protein
MQVRLRLRRRQVLAFRRRVGGLDTRMPGNAKSLRRAAWAGLQDSMPRAALLSLHARVEGVEPSTWEHLSLAQLWGPRYQTYVVAKRDFALFSLGRRPDNAKGRLRAEQMAERPRLHLDGERMVDREVGRALGMNPYAFRYAAPSGTVAIRWTAPEHRPSGRSRRPKSTRPTRAASSLDATSTSSGRRRPTGSPAGRGSRGARRPTPSPRSQMNCFPSARRSATSGCSQTTSRPCAPPRPPPLPRGCCRVAMRTSCSTGQQAHRCGLGQVRMQPGTAPTPTPIVAGWLEDARADAVRAKALQTKPAGTRSGAPLPSRLPAFHTSAPPARPCRTDRGTRRSSARAGRACVQDAIRTPPPAERGRRGRLRSGWARAARAALRARCEAPRLGRPPSPGYRSR